MATQTIDGRLLTVAQAANVLGISRSHAYALVREQAVPSIHFNGAIRVPAGALKLWLGELEQEALQAVRSG